MQNSMGYCVRRATAPRQAWAMATPLPPAGCFGHGLGLRQVRLLAWPSPRRQRIADAIIAYDFGSSAYSISRYAADWKAPED